MSTTYLLKGRNRSTTIIKANHASASSQSENKGKCLRYDPVEPQRHAIFVASIKLAAMRRMTLRVLVFDAERCPNRVLWNVGTLTDHPARRSGLIEGETLVKLHKVHA